MIKIENVQVSGFEAAMRGMRAPMQSWAKSDSMVGDDGIFYIGDADVELAQKLFKAGTEHRKFMRFIDICMDVTAPRYWWTEFDTYHFADRNSCSTMHTIMKRPFTREDFSFDHVHPLTEGVFDEVISHLNVLRTMYTVGLDDDIEKHDKWLWYSLISLLPQSYMQKATIHINYETAANIIRQRSNHKLEEWHKFCDVLKQAPLLAEIMGLEIGAETGAEEKEE